MIMKTVPTGTRIIVSRARKEISLFEFEKNQLKLRQHYDPNLKMEGNHCRTNTRVRSRKEIQKSRAVLVTVRDPGGNANHLSKIV